MQEYNYSCLLGKMRERGYTQQRLAKELGISETSLNFSLNNKRNFKQDEMIKAAQLLGIPQRELAKYFFTKQL
jgi:transcriptional regulator with XRE-family HTH domain